CLLDVVHIFAGGRLRREQGGHGRQKKGHAEWDGTAQHSFGLKGNILRGRAQVARRRPTEKSQGFFGGSNFKSMLVNLSPRRTSSLNTVPGRPLSTICRRSLMLTIFSPS